MGLVPPRLIRPCPEPDYNLLKGVRIYQPYKPVPDSRRNLIQAYEREMAAIKRYIDQCRFVDWESIKVWIEYAEGLRKAAMQSPDDDPAVAEAPKSLDEVRVQWGITAQEAADALCSVFRGRNSATLALMQGIEREVYGREHRNDEIALCGYEEL